MLRNAAKLILDALLGRYRSCCHGDHLSLLLLQVGTSQVWIRGVPQLGPWDRLPHVLLLHDVDPWLRSLLSRHQ